MLDETSLMFGMGWLGMLTLLTWVAALGLVIWGLSGRTPRGRTSAEADALAILRRRYADGEISREEFLQAAETLPAPASDTHTDPIARPAGRLDDGSPPPASTLRGTAMSRLVSRGRSRGIPTLLLVAVPLVVVVVAVAFGAAKPRATNPPPQQAAVPHFVDVNAPGDQRIVVVGGLTDTLPGTSNEAGYLMANLREGQIPDGATTAMVLSDTNCAPDEEGISHCLNDLQIGDVVVTVQHHHAMAEVPCLSPGETVRLVTYAEYQGQL